GKRTCEEFRGHAQESTHPHPEDGTWATHHNGYSNTADVPHANGGSQGAGKRLKVVDVARVIGIIVLTCEHLEAVLEVTIGDKTRKQRKKETATDQKHE